jgi:hypothetical protein
MTEAEVDLTVEELGCLALAITIAGSYRPATRRLLCDLRLYLPEYYAQRERLLGRKPARYIH